MCISIYLICSTSAAKKTYAHAKIFHYNFNILIVARQNQIKHVFQNYDIS